MRDPSGGAPMAIKHAKPSAKALLFSAQMVNLGEGEGEGELRVANLMCLSHYTPISYA